MLRRHYRLPSSINGLIEASKNFGPTGKSILHLWATDAGESATRALV
jgi:hypothetical protein